MKTIARFVSTAFAFVILVTAALTTKADPGDIFVSDVTNGVIHRFASDGTVPLFATGLSTPEGLAFDSAGNLFEADNTSYTIYKFGPDGVPTLFANLNVECNNNPNGPYGLAFDSAGNLFVSTGNGGSIEIFDLNGKRTSTFTSGCNPVDYPAYVGLAFDAAGYLFATDVYYNHSNAIYRFDLDGIRSTFATGLHYPVGLAFDTAGYLFEADDGTGTINKFNHNGMPSTFATFDTEIPLGLAFDSAGYLFTATNAGDI